MPNPSTDSWPNDPLLHALQWTQNGHPAAVATVIGTWGSSPRPVGSVMTICGDGRVEGSVSGGCVEADVISRAQEIMSGAPPTVLTYGVSNETAWGVGLACGGRLDVFVQAIGGVDGEEKGAFPAADLKAIAAALRDRRPVRLARRLDGAHQALVDGPNPNSLPDDILRALTEPPRSGCARVTDGADAEWFLQTIAPPPRLLIIGAVHIAQALAPMARLAGFTAAIIDPRTGLATPERFPGQTLLTDWPDDALDNAHIDPTTAVVTLTHDAKLDDPALARALVSPAFYVGALGSRATQSSRLKRLAEIGVPDDALNRLRGPVGLAIGAIGAEEIALSIMADIVATRRGARLSLEPGW
ncbi:xanthine dehydrogenase accessory factor XdhC/CoxI [Acetobacter nitrogenifigens DSM 23921 = NBRC 105050]|uniref:XdhC/CoxI family protein n=1 Tax=Acetobacter nitrogenifigens DSM 23921 = NBRC 105050 TaxID=1120919 RepID=A0A511X8I2_9PROT|nr:XdhC family protein [Acetobacter nitrogenifigens]GBQ91865.1 xanthine dehydrogenase accessory factor XdhC/CoxI [Acetobacter nitrogenifigens DSM 23921 = NBRC 105050]GEN59255.1 XdhC/CoxI family protein [Acetobacter nitrogenifigens DSM 23921 = NBRC 105050]